MSKVKSPQTHKDRAKAAATKPAALGEDIDLSAYTSSAEEQPYQADPSQLPAKAKELEPSSRWITHQFTAQSDKRA